MPTLYQIISISGISAFLILFIGIFTIKGETIRHIVISHAPLLVSKAFDCDFCLSFWMSLVVSIIFAVISGDFGLLMTPMIATPLIRFLL